MFPKCFSPSRDLLSPPRAITKPSLPPMRPPPKPPQQNNEMAVKVVSPNSNPKTVLQSQSLMAASPPSWLAPTHPLQKPPWKFYNLHISSLSDLTTSVYLLFVLCFCFMFALVVFEEKKTSEGCCLLEQISVFFFAFCSDRRSSRA